MIVYGIWIAAAVISVGLLIWQYRSPRGDLTHGVAYSAFAVFIAAVITATLVFVLSKDDREYTVEHTSIPGVQKVYGDYYLFVIDGISYMVPQSDLKSVTEDAEPGKEWITEITKCLRVKESIAPKWLTKCEVENKFRGAELHLAKPGILPAWSATPKP